MKVVEVEETGKGIYFALLFHLDILFRKWIRIWLYSIPPLLPFPKLRNIFMYLWAHTDSFNMESVLKLFSEILRNQSELKSQIDFPLV